MSDGIVQVAPDSTGKKVDTSEITVGANTVERQRINIADPVTAANIQKVTANGESTVIVPDVTAAISIVANNGTSQLTVSGRKSFAFQVTGTWVGTLVFEANIDPTNSGGWVSVDVWDESTEKFVTSATVNGNWWMEPIGSVGAVRVRASAWSSGTATGLILAGMADMGTFEFTGAAGAVVPNNIAAVGGSDGTNLRTLSVDSAGVLSNHLLPSASSTFSPSNADTSSSFEASRVIKASAGVLYGLSGYSNKSTQQFIMIFNSTTVPADTSLPVVIITVPPNSNFFWDSGTYGKFFSTGISISNSSTVPGKTIGVSDCWFNAMFS